MRFLLTTANNFESPSVNGRLTEHQIHGTEDERQFEAAFLGVDLVARDEVAETYGRQRDEAEVRTIQHVPVFPFRKQDSAAPDIPDERVPKEAHVSQSATVFPREIFSNFREEFNRGTC